jgi:precorrin-6B methylase 2
MARTHNEQIIAFKGHLTGVKREIRILATSVYKLEKKVETLFWSILCGLGALSLALVTIFLAK